MTIYVKFKNMHNPTEVKTFENTKAIKAEFCNKKV